MITGNIKKIYFNGSVPARVYYSSLLVWQRLPEGGGVWATTIGNGSVTMLLNGTNDNAITVPSGVWTGFGDVSVTSFINMCANLDTLKEFSIYFDTSNVTSILGMFKYCTALSSVDVKSMDVSKVTNFGSAFLNCSSLETLDLSSWYTIYAETMSGMFKGCSSLETLYIDLFNSSNLDSQSDSVVSGMFEGCDSLATIRTNAEFKQYCLDRADAMSLPSVFRNPDYEGWIVV